MIKETEFQSIFKEYYQGIFRYVWLRVLNKDTALDLTQEVFLRVWNKRDKLNGNRSVKSYLFKVAHNILIDFYRKRESENKKMKEFSERLDRKGKNIYNNPSDLYITLNELPEKIRYPFVLSRLEGFTNEEIAEILGVSKNTASCYVSRAIVMLKKKL